MIKFAAIVTTITAISLSAFTFRPVAASADKVNFHIQMHDDIGGTDEQWKSLLEEAAGEKGLVVTAEDSDDSSKVLVIIGRDDDDDDNDGIKDAADTDDDGDGIEDAKQNERDVDIDGGLPELQKNEKNDDKAAGIYFAVVKENGDMTVFRSVVDAVTPDASAGLKDRGFVLQNASYNGYFKFRAMWRIVSVIVTTARVVFVMR